MHRHPDRYPLKQQTRCNSATMTKSDSVLLISDERMLNHDPGPGHPERPDRLRTILESLAAADLPIVSPAPATRAMIERVHDPAYIDRIDRFRGRPAQLDADTATSAGTIDAAYLAAGASIAAVESIMHARAASAFALVRPPGHHAERDHAMGFCLFNNIAIAAAHAIDAFHLKRVLIVDWDVHHGNGTQHTFESRSDVLVFNTHQHHLFPDTGNLDERGCDAGLGYTINIPLPPGIDDLTMTGLYRQVLAPIADAYKPELVLVSAGFDAHRDDPLGGMNLTAAGFANLCAIARSIAHTHAAGRIALILEGGYNLQALSESVRACIDVLQGQRPPPIASPGPLGERIITAMREYHSTSWPVLRDAHPC
jgi:acetoin utilization deacetylase AcuC-like enzyme